MQFWQEEICPHGEVAARPYLETSAIAPLTSDEANELRDRFNPTKLRYALIATDHSGLTGTTLFSTLEEAEIFADDRRIATIILPVI